ncbi:MAG TPA: hypothetical protein VHS58_17410 [Acetobacteraceae bacterium]|jgi:hypothetical protein|nr:hypothetical protein [Acetobacteraceae bacterium]
MAKAGENAERSGSAEIIPFPIRPKHRRLDAQDRMVALHWAESAGRAHAARVAICEEPDPDIGDFVLVYEDGRPWASWGVSREGARFVVWGASGPDMIGRFASMREALDAIPEHSRPERGACAS